MNMNNVKVNETHMCVLRKVENEDRVKVDFIELKSPYQECLDELKRMADNDNRTVIELQDYVKGSSLNRFTSDFDFCSFLSDPYQWIPCLPKISFADYQLKIEEFDKQKDVSGKEKYVRKERQNYYRRIKNRDLPATLENLYYTLGKDPSVLAYSHRRVGWASPEFKLNDDIKVAFLTNFGYGRASYFFLQIHYKDIGILPYSEWVHYRYASTYDIIRYTRRFHLENNEWIKAMSFTADVYNTAVANPASFIQKNILNEVEEMVSGLETILKTTGYKVLENYFYPGNGDVITGDELTLFKGEKISGALDFLEQLQKLVAITNNVNSYIRRIMQCNLSVSVDLEKAIAAKKTKLEELLSQIEKEKPIWETMNEKNDEYDRMREEMYNLIKEEESYQNESYSVISNERNTRFAKEHPEYDAFKKEYDAEYDKYHSLCSSRDEAEKFVELLLSYLDKIESHKDYLVENNIAA